MSFKHFLLVDVDLLVLLRYQCNRLEFGSYRALWGKHWHSEPCISIWGCRAGHLTCTLTEVRGEPYPKAVMGAGMH